MTDQWFTVEDIRQQDLDSAYKSGYAAFKSWILYTDMPLVYDNDADLAFQWRSGWLAAESDWFKEKYGD